MNLFFAAAQVAAEGVKAGGGKNPMGKDKRHIIACCAINSKSFIALCSSAINNSSKRKFSMFADLAGTAVTVVSFRQEGTDCSEALIRKTSNRVHHRQGDE